MDFDSKIPPAPERILPGAKSKKESEPLAGAASPKAKTSASKGPPKKKGHNLSDIKPLCKTLWLSEDVERKPKDFEAHWKALNIEAKYAWGTPLWEKSHE